MIVIRGDGRAGTRAEGTADDRAVAASDLVPDECTQTTTNSTANCRINALIASERRCGDAKASNQDQ